MTRVRIYRGERWCPLCGGEIIDIRPFGQTGTGGVTGHFDGCPDENHPGNLVEEFLHEHEYVITHEPPPPPHDYPWNGSSEETEYRENPDGRRARRTKHDPPPVPPPPKEKTCPRCGETKPGGQFSRNRQARDGRNSWCKACVTEAGRRKRQNSDLLEDLARQNGVFA